MSRMRRVLAILLLLVSLATFVPIIAAGLRLAKGEALQPERLMAPFLILATGAVLMWFLARTPAPHKLYLAAFSLWLLTAGYLFLL